MENQILKYASLVLLFFTSCTLFFGTIKPMEIKSHNYQVLDLSSPENLKNERHPWEKAKEGSRPGDENSDLPDLTFQNQTTHSTISLNSTCRNYKGAVIRETPTQLTQGLLLGLADQKIQKQNEIKVGELKGEETIVRGRISQQDIILRSVVVVHGNCVYDLLLIATPQSFKNDDPIFSKFVTSFRLK